MQERDIIITAFSCGGKMKCKKEAETFENPPLVLSVPGGTAEGFVKTAKSFKQQHSVLDGFFAAKLKKVKPRRVCLVSFDIGWAWTTQVLRAKWDIGRIDSVIVMDGIHTSSLKAWIDYARMASEGFSTSPWLWLAHTQIKPQKGVSAKTTNTKIFKESHISKPGTVEITIPDHITNVKFDKPVTVYSKDETPKRKIYHSDPLYTFEQYGNLVRLEYEGSKLQDHIYNAQYVQPRIWQWLRERWSNQDIGVLLP